MMVDKKPHPSLIFPYPPSLWQPPGWQGRVQPAPCRTMGTDQNAGRFMRRRTTPPTRQLISPSAAPATRRNARPRTRPPTKRNTRTSVSRHMRSNARTLTEPSTNKNVPPVMRKHVAQAMLQAMRLATKKNVATRRNVQATDITSSATVFHSATVCQSRSRCKNPLNLATMFQSSSASRWQCKCQTRSVWKCQGSNAVKCQFRGQSKCLSSLATRCPKRSVSKSQSKFRNRFQQKSPKRFARTVMDTAEMVVGDPLVDSTEANLVALVVGRLVLGGNDGIQSKQMLPQQKQITKATQFSRQQATRIEPFITYKYTYFMTQINTQ